MDVTTVLRHVWIDSQWFGILCLPAEIDHDKWIRERLKQLGADYERLEVGVPGSASPQWNAKNSRAQAPQVEFASDAGPTGKKP